MAVKGLIHRELWLEHETLCSTCVCVGGGGGEGVRKEKERMSR